jgi:hypothetical protein
MAVMTIVLISAASAAAQDVTYLRDSPIHLGPEPRTCPERGAWGFCFYDNGWRPAADNPAFQAMRRGDPEPSIGPTCAITNRRGATLGYYGEEEEGPMLRIGGRAIHFRRAEGGDDEHELFRAREGRLTIVDGATVARAAEWESHRARISFTDRRGRVLSASVRIDCGS